MPPSTSRRRDRRFFALPPRPSGMLGSVPVLDVPSPRGIRTHLFVPPRVRFRGVVSLEVYPHGVHGRGLSRRARTETFAAPPVATAPPCTDRDDRPVPRREVPPRRLTPRSRVARGAAPPHPRCARAKSPPPSPNPPGERRSVEPGGRSVRPKRIGTAFPRQHLREVFTLARRSSAKPPSDPMSTPRRLIARIPPPPPPPRVPLGESQPRVSAGARYPVPREAHRWASSRGSARRRTRCTGRTALGRREAETRPTTRRDRRTREPRERRRRADTRESRRGWSLERSREARRDAFPGRARRRALCPERSRGNTLLERPGRNPPGSPGPETEPGARLASEACPGPSRGPWVPSSL